MHQHTGVGNVVGMELDNFEVVGSLRRFKMLQRYAFYFAERSVGKKNFIAASLFHYNTGERGCQGGGACAGDGKISSHFRAYKGILTEISQKTMSVRRVCILNVFDSALPPRYNRGRFSGTAPFGALRGRRIYDQKTDLRLSHRRRRPHRRARRGHRFDGRALRKDGLRQRDDAGRRPARGRQDQLLRACRQSGRPFGLCRHGHPARVCGGRAHLRHPEVLLHPEQVPASSGTGGRDVRGPREEQQPAPQQLSGGIPLCGGGVHLHRHPLRARRHPVDVGGGGFRLPARAPFRHQRRDHDGVSFLSRHPFGRHPFQRIPLSSSFRAASFPTDSAAWGGR